MIKPFITNVFFLSLKMNGYETKTYQHQKARWKERWHKRNNLEGDKTYKCVKQKKKWDLEDPNQDSKEMEIHFLSMWMIMQFMIGRIKHLVLPLGPFNFVCVSAPLDPLNNS